ncbi:hypothetical protein [Actinocorallia longicatena]|uniref:CBS domain-containing protein n=1 Tax=Actinocorallia longicatena TaxID=111803 RepID=A0ABP6Q6U5_9ACTN
MGSEDRPGTGAPTIREAMIRAARLHPLDTTVAEASAALANPHVHLLLLVEDRILHGTLTTGDLTGAPGPLPALRYARLAGRTIAADADLALVHAEMISSGRRRLAVVDSQGALLGLLCLKASRTGFCTDQGIAARARPG